MTIKTRLKLAALAPLLLALVVSLAMMVTESVRETAQRRRAAAAGIIRSVNDLSHLLGQYILHGTERPSQQFLDEHETLERELASLRLAGGEQQRLLAGIREAVHTLGESFLRLRTTSELLQATPADTTLVWQKSRLAGQLLVRSRQVAGDGIRLEALVNNQTAAVQRTVNLVVFCLILGLALPTTVILVRMMASISSHLATLHAGTQVVGTGQLDHRIGLAGSDELASLGGAFDHMTENLQALTVSKHDLEKEVEEHRRTEAALRESESFYRQTLESIPGMTFTTRPDGYCDFQSRQWVDYTGVPMAEHVGDGWNKLLHPDDRPRALAAWQAAVAGRAPYDLEYRVRRFDGEHEWFRVIGRPICNSAGEVVRWFGTAMNIQTLKEAEAALAAANADLERKVAERTSKLQELVGELEHFSYTITHDMRAPLRAMKCFGEMTADLCAGCDKHEPRGFLKKIIGAADRMDLLITDALDYNKAVRQELTLELVDAGALLRGMLDTYPEFQGPGADICIEGEIPPVVANKAALTQCFSNLLDNAVKFAKPRETAKIRVWAEIRDGMVRIWIEDNGIGIPAIFQPRVFEMFSRGQKSYEGTGIGLALVRKVVERMSGRVGVVSEDGKGSRFWLELFTA